MKVQLGRVFLIAIGGLLAISAHGRVQAASMAITEWAYAANAPGGEYVEFTNVSNAPIDMTNWSEDDNDRNAGKHDFGTTFGIVQPGQSVLMTEVAPATFRSVWNLPSTVAVWGPYTDDNLGRSDEINLYDASNNLVDRLTFNDQTGQGPRANNVGANIPLADLGMNKASSAVLSVVGDAYGSYKSTAGDIGNPGTYTPFQVPEPATITLIATAALMLVTRRLVGGRKVASRQAS